MTDNVYGSVLRTFEKYDMGKGISGILCAFSGGADSSVLLCILADICRQRGLGLRVVHVNHGIRGEEADRDERFCVDFCGRRDIPITVCRVDVPSFARENGIGTEEAARILRYSEFERIRGKEEAVATAHNSTDNAETVIFNLIRGSGSRGLSGIPPVRGCYIRPLILSDRESVRSYAASNGIEYVEDSTNLDTSYTRNYIRAEIIPRMKKINPSFERSVFDCSEILREEDGFISGIAEEKSADLFSDGMDAGSFSLLPNPLRYRMLLEAFRSAGGDALSSVHTEAVFALAEKGEPHSRADLPGGISAVIEEGRLKLVHRRGDPEPRGLTGTVRLAEGENRFPEFGFDIFVFRGGSPDGCGFDRNVYKLSIFEKIDFDKIIGSLVIRPRMAGDSYRSHGMTKTVRRMMSEKKLDVGLRSRIPLICDSDGIVWIPGFSVCDRVYPGKGHGSGGSDIATICYAEY